MDTMTLPLFVTLLGASAWAVREDLLAHRIPNRLTASLLCVGLVLQFYFGGWSALGQAVLGGLVGLTMLMPMYLLRATGGGDVKLLAGIGALLGPHLALLAGLYTLIAGGVLALGYLLVRASAAAIAATGMPWSVRMQCAFEQAQQLRRERFPYALAIAIGAIGAASQHYLF